MVLFCPGSVQTEQTTTLPAFSQYLKHFFPLSLLNRTGRQWFHQRCHHDDRAAVRLKIDADRISGKWVRYCIVPVSGASVLLRWPDRCLQAALDWVGCRGNGPRGVRIRPAAFFGGPVPGDQFGAECLLRVCGVGQQYDRSNSCSTAGGGKLAFAHRCSIHCTLAN